MARTAVTPTSLVGNGSVANPAGTTIDATLVTNGVTITPTKTAERLYVRVNNTHGSDHVVTVKAGTSTAALDAGRGDLTVTVPATSGSMLIGPLTSARFAQPGNAIYIDFDSGTTGTIAAFHIPRAWS